MAMMAYGFTHGHPVLYFNLAYVVLIVTLFLLDAGCRMEREWTKPDGQTLAEYPSYAFQQRHGAAALAVRRYHWADGVDARARRMAFGRAAGRWRRR